MPTWHSTHDGMGLDRLSFSFPVRDYAPPDRTEVAADGSLTRAVWRVRHAARREAAPAPMADDAVVSDLRTEVAVHVSVRFVAGRAIARADANPSRFADPDGCSLLPPTMVYEALSVMWAAAREVVDPIVELGDARATRVDVARDFRGVTSPALYVGGLSRLHPTYARRAFTYNDPARGNAETLFVGSNAGGVRLYDQHAAYAEKGAPEGSLRFEVEARGDWLERAGAKRVGDLDAVVAERLALARWEWSKMGSTVTGPVNAVEVLQRAVQAGEFKQAVADRLLGAMVRRSFGYGGASKRSEYRYAEVADRLGLTAEALWSDDLSRQASGRLDFDTGTEFLALSA